MQMRFSRALTARKIFILTRKFSATKLQIITNDVTLIRLLFFIYSCVIGDFCKVFQALTTKWYSFDRAASRDHACAKLPRRGFLQNIVKQNDGIGERTRCVRGMRQHTRLLLPAAITTLSRRSARKFILGDILMTWEIRWEEANT